MGKLIETLRDSSIKVSIWKVQVEKPFYTVSISKSFLDKEGNWIDSTSFSYRELQKLKPLLKKAEQNIEEFMERE